MAVSKEQTDAIKELDTALKKAQKRLQDAHAVKVKRIERDYKAELKDAADDLKDRQATLKEAHASRLAKAKKL
jgi:cellobiose-specific phosphotransferase system component IIA